MNRTTVLFVLGLTALFIALPATSAAENTQSVREILSRLELFVDDWLIERMENVSLRLHEPVPREVALRFDTPWEGLGSTYVTILTDTDGYRMYYRGSGEGGTPETTCYAVSQDGITWTRPKLGLFEHAGSKANNIIWTGQLSHCFTPFIDTNPDCPPDSKYKATSWGHKEPDRPLFALKSADGIRWSKLGEEPILHGEGFDSQNVFFWDHLRKLYVGYYRLARRGKRDILTATSKDFLKWTEPVFLDYGGVPLEHFYTNAISPYFRAPHIYLGFPKRFVPDRHVVTEQPEKGVSDALFMSSRDGLRWDRRFREAFIRPGRSRLNWMHRSNMVALGYVQTAPDEISIYYGEHYCTPDNQLRRATLRLDGFVSVHARAAVGQMITRPLRFQGDSLVINYSTSAAGTIRVEVQEADGTPMPDFTLDECVEIYGDEIARHVKWTSDKALSELQDRPIRLRFVMNDADLYSLKFCPQPTRP